MKLEIIVHKVFHSNENKYRKVLAEHFCIMNESNKQPNRTRIKKLLCRYLPWMFPYKEVIFLNKDDIGHYHVTKSGDKTICPYHFWWYHFEIIPYDLIKNETVTNEILGKTA